jgi:hypothetical protein
MSAFSIFRISSGAFAGPSDSKHRNATLQATEARVVATAANMSVRRPRTRLMTFAFGERD